MTQTTELEIQEEVTSSNETVSIQEVEINNEPSVLRTPFDGCFEVYQGPWGKYLRSCADPDANIEVTKENLEFFEMNEKVHKIPATLWSRWSNLCFYFVDKVANEVEVSVRILRSKDDPSVYRMLIPRQKVSGASVRVDSFDESIDIETGEEFTSYPPEGWVPVGSSHSHNTMPAFFSGTDDKYELGDPGIHLVVGSIKVVDKTYTIAASVVGNGRRFTMHYNNLVDATPVNGADFHPKVIDYIDYTSPITVTTTTYSRYTTKSKGASSITRYGESSRYSDYYSYNKWLEKYNDPDGYSQLQDDDYWQSYGRNYNEGSVTQGRAIKLWEIEDIIHDYLEQNTNDFNQLWMLYDTLQDMVKEAEKLAFSSEAN